MKAEELVLGSWVRLRYKKYGTGLILAMSERGRVDIDSEYVHELQNALRLCGIEKEIVL